MTNNFAPENELGRGGFGAVYKGELEDGTKLAVKRMEAGVVSNTTFGYLAPEYAGKSVFQNPLPIYYSFFLWISILP